MKHIAMIMDGNRRWARENNFKAVTMGHKKALDSIRVAVRFCLKRKIEHLSLYTFSIENFKRSEDEKSYLFDLLINSKQELTNLVKEGIKIKFVGDRKLFPETVLSTIEEVERKTEKCDKLNLYFLFCYGSQQEIVDAAKKIAEKVKIGALSIDSISEKTFRKATWLGDIPDPEVIIRTGRDFRLSNFLLFQAAYSELMFLDCYWPEISEEKLDSCIDGFYKLKRNFGN